VRGGTGSGVLLGPRHKLSPNWIAFRVTKRRPQMRSIDRAGIVAILPKMSYPMTAGVEVEGITAMSAAQGYAEGLRLIGNRHKMDMIAHEAISKNAKASLRGVGLEAIDTCDGRHP